MQTKRLREASAGAPDPSNKRACTGLLTNNNQAVREGAENQNSLNLNAHAPCCSTLEFACAQLHVIRLL